MSSTREALKSLLMEFNRSAGVMASALVTRDGILISSALPEGIDAEAFAAMTATMMGAAETAFSELKAGAAERVIVEGSRVKICLLYTSPSPRDGLLSRMPSSA